MQEPTDVSAGRRASEALRELLRHEGMSSPAQAAHTIAAATSAARPALFGERLCAGYPLHPSPDQFFVAQEFSADRADLLGALEEAFQAFDLKPYRADRDILPGHLLCKIAAKIQTTLFSVFELTRTQNRNVYLELGVALGLGRPFVLVKEDAAQVAPTTLGLDYYNLRSYRALGQELGDRVESYLLAITRYRSADLPAPASAATYVIAHGDHDMPPDLCVTLAETLAGRGLRPVPIGAGNGESIVALRRAGLPPEPPDDAGLSRLDATTRAIQAARFGIYRVDAACSADAFLALGLAIGLSRPWLLVSREGATLPADVRGLSALLQFPSFTELGNLVPARFGPLLDRFS